MIFPQVTYGGMPVVAEGLAVLRRVLEERGEWSAASRGRQRRTVRPRRRAAGRRPGRPG